jgi:alkanesulfonate monooxygenase SsuD/methylene tetrahydromethanopterin reductase-like flavin-dependent oxidoreductase (luciferase family)
MEYWHFSETPYPDLPPEESYDSIRVTMPNSVIDPDKAADLWERYIEDWKVADEAGINIMVNEHHATATCMNAAAPVVAAALSQATKNAKILVLGNPVSNRKDPVRIAEEMALVDLLSRGRLEAGFVRGVPYEVSATNSSPVRMNERMWEAIDLIKAAWENHDGPFNWEGEHFQHRQINIWPRPYTQPHPPIWVTGMSPTSVPRIADNDYVLATFLTGYEGTKKVFDAYRTRWAESGKGEVPADRLAYCAMTYVGRTDDEGMEGAEQLMWYLRSNKVPPQFILPPGYTPYFIRAAALQGGKSAFDLASMTMDQLLNSGIMFAGSPSTVTAQIEKFHDRVGGFGHLILHGQAGFMDHDTTSRGIRNFVELVKPRLDSLFTSSTPFGAAVAAGV